MSGINIAFIGSRGIPPKYGGSEVITEELAVRLSNMGFNVYVTCESNKFYEDKYEGVTRVHIPSLQSKSFTIPTINDVVATWYLLRRYPEINLYCYTNPDVALGALFPRFGKKKVLINTDGIEWKRPLIRAKYLSPFFRLIAYLGALYLRFTEWLAIHLAHKVIADSKAIKEYLEKTYNSKNVIYITYGARQLLKEEISEEKEKEILNQYNLKANDYYLTVARIVAENNIHVEITGWKKSGSKKPLVIIGNFSKNDRYCRYLVQLKGEEKNIVFLNPIYFKETLGILRKNCFAYIHAYELGGTNPSLLEQMYFGKPILAMDVPFNKEVLGEGGWYFTNEIEFLSVINKLELNAYDHKQLKAEYIDRLNYQYNWDLIVSEYKVLTDTHT